MLTGMKNRLNSSIAVLAALIGLSLALAACGTFEVGIEATPTPQPTQAPQPLSYTNAEYGFTFQYPPGWQLDELPNQISLTRADYRLTILFQHAGQAFDPALVGSGMPAGDLIYRGKVAFINQVVPANALVYEQKDKAVYYGDGPIQTGGLDFLARLESIAGQAYDAVEIPAEIEAEATATLESLKLTGQQVEVPSYEGAQGEPTPSPAAGQPGSLGGKICYPSEIIPAMTAFFQNLDSGALTSLAIDENQSSYQIDLPAGNYQVYAYQDGVPTVGGGYTRAVNCGLTPECTDHSLLETPVSAGQATRGADLCDWYDPSYLPANPNASEPADPAAEGMVYYHPTNGLWQVQADGTARWLFPFTDAEAISPDGRLALLARNDDLWLADRANGALRNLTNTPDRLEFEPLFWPSNPDVIVFGSVGVDEEKSLSSGHLTRINLDGSGYQVLEPDGLSIGAGSLAPDGKTIAYETADQAWIYRDDSGRVAFDPQTYGVSGVERTISPAWSPDGSKIAWWIGGHLNGSVDYTLALGVFDLAAGSATLLHPYTPIGGDGWPVNPVWDASGQWLATQVIGDGSRGALWALRADGGDAVNLGNSAYPVWDPQGSGLIYVEWGGGSFEDSIDKLTHIGDWTLQPLEMQPGSLPFAWLER